MILKKYLSNKEFCRMEKKLKETEINKYINRIITQPVNYIGRTSNMLRIEIGENCERFSRLLGKNVITSTYTLHIQAAWRIENEEKKEIVIASYDMYSPRTGVEYSVDFDWEPQGNNLFDEKSQKWMQRNNSIFIKDCKINVYGDLLLIFSNNERLRVFVKSSNETESWRMFSVSEQEPHLVASGLGYSLE